MAETEYTYSVADDTLNALVDVSVIHDEAVADVATATFSLPAHVNGDVITFTTDPALTGGEETTLDATVAAHDGAAYPEPVLFVSSNDIDSSTSTSYVDVPDMSITPGVGVHLIFFNARHTAGDAEGFVNAAINRYVDELGSEALTTRALKIAGETGK